MAAWTAESDSLVGSLIVQEPLVLRAANDKGVDFSALINALLRKDIELIEMAK